MLTGEVGAGKTTVRRHLTAQLHPGRYRGHYVSLTTGNVLDTYRAIGWELGLSFERSRSSAHHAIRTEISRLATEAKQLPVLVIDEAHHLRNDVLEALCLLTNFAMDSENRMCLILVGLTELRRRLSMAVHASLSQRVLDETTLAPFCHRLGIEAVALAQILDRSLRSLYCRSDSVSSRGAAMKYLSHSTSWSMVDDILPSHSGTEHLGSKILLSATKKIKVERSAVFCRDI